MDDDPERLAVWAAHQLLDAMLEGTAAQSGGIARGPEVEKETRDAEEG